MNYYSKSNLENDDEEILHSKYKPYSIGTDGGDDEGKEYEEEDEELFTLDSEADGGEVKDTYSDLEPPKKKLEHIDDINKLSQGEIEELLNRYNERFSKPEEKNSGYNNDEDLKDDDYSYDYFKDDDYTYQAKPKQGSYPNQGFVDVDSKAKYKKGENFSEKIKFLPHNLKTFLTLHKKPIGFLVASVFFLFLAIAGGLGIWVYGIYSGIEGGIADRATRISEGSIVFDNNGDELFRFQGDIERELVSLDEIPKKMQLAMIALEDENFYDNEAGIPWQNLIGAMIRCGLTRGRECRGGSGLSQQLVKNVTDDNDDSVERKVRELFTAMRFNEELPGTSEDKQDKVLELYLNWVPFGRNTYGVRAASRSYFGHDINSEELTIPKACYLASMPQIPSLFAEGVRLEILNRERVQNGEEPLANPNFERLEARKNICIEKLYELELADRGTRQFITSREEVERLKQEEVEFKRRTVSENIEFGHLRSYLANEIQKKFNDGTDTGITPSNLETRGYRIFTTIDRGLQEDLENLLKNANEIDAAGGNNAAGMVMHGKTGEIRAMIGSRDFNNEEIGGQVNVLKASRQPGSSFKPYVYAAAMANNFNPSTVLLDVETDFGGGYVPRNFSRTFSGITTIRRSLQDSLNVTAIKSAYLAQVPSATPNTASASANTLNYAERLGVNMPFKQNCDLTAALGACEVEHLSHVVGFNTLLQEGIKVEPRIVSKIELRDNVLFSKERVAERYEKQQVMDRSIANQMANIMSDYGSRSPSVWGNFRFFLQLQGWDGVNSVAAKTGTTNDVRDMWAMGGSSQYTVSLWIGNTDNKKMDPNTSAARVAGPIWNKMMTRVHKDITPSGFSRAGLQPVSIDPQTGLLGEGATELLTREQITELEQAQNRFNDPDYNPLERSIFDNRTPVTRRQVRVNRIDNRLVSSQTTNIQEDQLAEESTFRLDFNLPEEIIQEMDCRGIVSEFPLSDNWREPAEEIALQEDSEACPTEISQITLDDVKPIITSNLLANRMPPSIIRINVKSGIDNSLLEEANEIVKIEFKVDDEVVASSTNTPELVINLSDKFLSELKDVEIVAIDRFGFKNTKIIENVYFNLTNNSNNSNNSILPINRPNNQDKEEKNSQKDKDEDEEKNSTDPDPDKQDSTVNDEML